MIEILLDVLWRIIRIIISIMVVGTIVYLILPWIFKRFVAPKFNAAYIYDSKDFSKETQETKKQSQINVPIVEVNRTNGIFKISFGESRTLSEGCVKIRYNQKIYSNQRTLRKGNKKLKLKSYNELRQSHTLGEHKTFKCVYKLEDDEIEIITSIKQYYNSNLVYFELEFPDGLKNTANGVHNALITVFPCFSNDSPNSHMFTYRHAIFCPPSRKTEGTSSPVVFYDDDLNCFVLSPLDGFVNAAINQSDNSRISCGIQGEIKEIPKNYSQKFLLTFNRGINASLENLGALLLKYHGSKKKDTYYNIAASHLSYWTDNGAYYYYRTEKDMSYEDTMVAVKDYFDSHGIPIKSYNFDSWWYLKYQSRFKKKLSEIFKPLYRILGGGLFGNTLRWEADPQHFSTDLKTYSAERFKAPIIAHSRRWDVRSPYVERFKFETYGKAAVPLEKEFWDWLMKMANESGILVYEQDWLKNQVAGVPLLRENITAAEQWLNSMALAGKEHGVDVFYCMQTPGMLLHSIKHPNVFMGRCSGDYNPRWPPIFRFVHCTQLNILFNAIGLIPHQDCFRTKYKSLGERRPEFACLTEILTAGLVAPSDKKENVDWSLLKYTCRDDGLLFKPDKPITANDLMFKKHRKYYICDTYTLRDDMIWRFILVSNIWPRRVKETYFTAEELGYKEPEFVLYDFESKIARKVKSTEEIEVGHIKKYQHKYYVLSSLAKNGMSLIGCPEKFVTCSKKQFTAVNSTDNDLTFSIEDLSNSSAKILIYSEKKPSKIQYQSGSSIEEKEGDNAWIYEKNTKLIRLNLKFNDNIAKTIVIS